MDFWDSYEKYVKPVTFDETKKDKTKEEDLLFDDETKDEEKDEPEKKKFEWDDQMFEDPEFMKVVAEKIAERNSQQEAQKNDNE